MQIDRPIAIALTIFIIILVVFFFAWPEYKTFRVLQTSLAEKIASSNARADYYAAMDRADFDLQKHQDDLQKIDDALPQDPAIGKLVYFLQDTAQKNGLLVRNLFLSKYSANNSGTNSVSNIKDIIFSADLSGDYRVLERFIIALEKSSRIFEVTSISFGSASGPPYNFSLQIKTHSY